MAEKNTKEELSGSSSSPVQPDTEARDIPQKKHENIRSAQSSSPTTSFLAPGVPASPPYFLSLEQIMKTAEDISKSGFNMALAHEIAVNKDFQLHKILPDSGYKNKLKELLHKAFWDILHEQLTSDPPDYSQAMVLLSEVKQGLQELLLPHHTRIKNEINEVLDIELIKQQAENDALDVLSYANFIILTMSRLCAPVRDSNIQELKQLTDIIPLYRGILETLDLMKLDMANFTIQQHRPLIQHHSIEYERKKFQEILDSLKGISPPVDGLKFTRQWLHNVYDELVKASSSVEELSEALVLRKAYIKILTWEEADSFPETLHLDHERFLGLRDSLTVMILTASVLLVTYSTVGLSIQGISNFKETLKNHIQVIIADAPQCSPEALEAKMETVGMQVAKEVNECLDEHGYTELEVDKLQVLILQIKNIASPDHSVRKLLRKRIFEFVELVLSSPTVVQIPPGLSSLKSELSGFCGQFLTLIRHNQSVFNEYYSDIILQHSRGQ